MTRIYLHPADSNADETDWGNAFSVLRRGFERSSGTDHELTDTPDSSDLILVCGPVRNPAFPMDLMRDRVVRENRNKCVRFSTQDYELPFLPGIYTSIEKAFADPRYHRGGFYPHVAEREPREPMPLSGEIPYLYSFLGTFDNHDIRSVIGRLSGERGLVRDTGSHPGNRSGMSASTYAEFKAGYLEALARSKFILCPPGMCPSTVRVFEAMKARRVPVILSDDWLRPEGVHWEEFCIFVRERDVGDIEGILTNREGEFESRALAARQEWERFFSMERMPGTVTEWALDLLRTSREDGRSRFSRVTGMTAHRLFEWNFWRRGVVPEVRRLASRFFRRAA